MSQITRRSFIKGAAATTAGAAIASGASVAIADEPAAAPDWALSLNVDIASTLPGCTSEEIEVVEEKDCDVLVIGAGCSGSNTAIRAAELGKKVILVEKSATIGGASNLSSGPIAYDSQYAKDAGAEPTDVLGMLNTWVADSHYRCDPASIKQLIEKSGEAVDWMHGNGWEFNPGFGPTSVRFPDYAVREGLFRDALDRTVIAGGGEVLTETCAKRLVKDDAGAVVGAVVVDAEGKGIQVNAPAVVIATGGYAGNRAMVNTVFRFDGVLGGLPQCIGEGLEMAWQAGAQKPQNFGGQMLHQTLARANAPLQEAFDLFPARYPMILCYLAQLMNVGASGVRFRNEDNALSAVGAANTSVYQGSFHYVIVSQAILNMLEEQGLVPFNLSRLPGLPPAYKPEYEMDTPWANVTEVFDKMVEVGGGFKGDTPRELAEAAGMDPDLFEKQFNDYQSFCETGIDTQMGKTPENLFPYGEGPFYAIIAEENSLGSWGGILTNTDYQALDYNRLPVKGLYAVGNECGSCLYNDTYVGGGVALGNAVTSGYICGTKLGEA